MKKKIILASGSERRKSLLKKAGMDFEVVVSDYEEDMNLPLSPCELAMFLSKGKAENVAEKYADAIIISADTFVVCDNHLLGKPHTPERAKETLRMLSGRSHTVVTGFTVMEKDGNCVSLAQETKVWIKELTEKMIDDYIETGEPLDKGGSYAAQGLGASLIDRIDGDIENVVGLPTKEVLEVLKEFGF